VITKPMRSGVWTNHKKDNEIWYDVNEFTGGVGGIFTFFCVLCGRDPAVVPDLICPVFAKETLRAISPV